MNDRLGTLVIYALFAIGGVAYSQPTFEVASVKVFSGGGRRMMTGGPGTPNPGQVSYIGLSLGALLQKAYGVLPDQILGPPWLNSELYSVIAKVPPGTTVEQFAQMLQALLSDRFRLALRHEQRERVAYELVVAKGGPKLKPSAEARLAPDPNALPQPAQSRKDDQGCPIQQPGVHDLAGSFGSGVQCTSARNYSLPEIAQWLEMFIPLVSGEPFGSVGKVHVIDRTGISGEYDFTLRFTFQPTFPGRVPDPDADDPGISLFAALEKDLGLRLEKKKALFDILVVDQASKTPTDN